MDGYTPMRYPPPEGWADGYLPIEDLYGPDQRSEWYLKFNGASSYGQFTSKIDVSASDSITFNVLIPQGVNQQPFSPFIDSETSTQRLSVRAGSLGTEFSIIGCTVMVDGSTVSNGDPLPNDGLLHDFEITPVGESNVFNIAVNFAGTAFINAIVANVKIKNGEEKADCPIDQKGSDAQVNLANNQNPINLFNVDQVNDWVEI